MANLQKVIKVTQAQYDILAGGGTVGGYTGLNDNYIYLVTDDSNDYKIGTIYAWDDPNEEWVEAAAFSANNDPGTTLTLYGNLSIYGDNDGSDTHKPEDETSSEDLNTKIYNTGINLRGDTEYKISFPAKNGVFAVTSDLPQVKRFI